jgi:hypothetical protein
VKPYIVDALVAVALTWLALDVLEAPDSRARGAGSVGGVHRHPAVHARRVRARRVGIALIAHPAIGRTRAGLVRLVGTGTRLGVLFALGTS